MKNEMAFSDYQWTLERQHGTLIPFWTTGWHKWFSWYPVLVDGDEVWLRTIERKMKQDAWFDGWASPIEKQYRLPL